MATNLAINLELLEKAFKIGHFKTKKETVNMALEEFVEQHKQQDILKYFGQIDFDQKFNYKKERSRL